MLESTLEGNVHTGVGIEQSGIFFAAALTLKIGWAKYMEWKYPVSVEITSPAAFKGAGAIQAAASL